MDISRSKMDRRFGPDAEARHARNPDPPTCNTPLAWVRHSIVTRAVDHGGHALEHQGNQEPPPQQGDILGNVEKARQRPAQQRKDERNQWHSKEANENSEGRVPQRRPVPCGLASAVGLQSYFRVLHGVWFANTHTR